MSTTEVTLFTPATEAPVRRRRRPARLGLAVAVAAATLLLLTACLNGEQQSALDALNKDRKAAGLASLGSQNDAQVKAQKWAEKMARENKLSHSTLTDGITVRWCGLGENVGVNSSIPATEAAFMRSTVHKGNILNRKWNGVGVGVAHNGSKVYIAQVFIQTC